MIKITDKSKCSGCHACAQACPKHSIVMEADAEGFLYPTVNEKTCVDCGKCEKVCPVLSPLQLSKTADQVCAFAAVSNDEAVRRNSSSGGMFSVFAESILADGGVVFGAALDGNMHLRHIAVDCIADLQRIRGSKYVQSEIGTAYQEAKAYLDSGRYVYFTGTPCQIAGLYRYLGKDYENLLTQDLICHGVPSSMVWERYVGFREELSASKTKSVSFRHKENGWRRYSVQFQFLNSAEYREVLSKDPYMRAFLGNYTLRPSCYACTFKDKLRCSDITLADFWGVQHVCPELDDDKGTSLVILNSEKAKKIFETQSDKMSYTEVNLDEAVSYNTAMICSAKKPRNRDAFMKAISSERFDKAVKRYVKKKPWIIRALGRIKRMLIKHK